MARSAFTTVPPPTLLVALANAMGLGIKSFGNPAYRTGVLPGILA